MPLQRSCGAGGLRAEGGGEGLELARDVGARGLVGDFGSALRFEHCGTIAPSCARHREPILHQDFAGNEWAITVVDRDQMLVMQREMADALGDGIVGRSPFLSIRDITEQAVLKGKVKRDRRTMTGSSKDAGRTRIFTLVEDGAEGQDDARFETGNGHQSSKDAGVELVRRGDALGPGRGDDEGNIRSDGARRSPRDGASA